MVMDGVRESMGQWLERGSGRVPERGSEMGSGLRERFKS